MANRTYKTIPVDAETYARLGKIVQALGFGQRGRGAVVRRLVSQEYARLLVAQLVRDEPESVPQEPA
jgi:hypothetical protein